MSLTTRGDLYITNTNTTFLSACASGTNFVAVTGEPRVRKWSIGPTSMIQVASSGSLSGSNPTDIMLISPATALIAYQASSRYDLVDINTLNITGITTNAGPTNTNAPQQVAGIPALNMALVTSNSNGRVTLVSLACAAIINPTALSGKQAVCTVPRLDTNTWLIGTNDGRVIEMNSSGTVLTTVSLPSAPFITTPSFSVQAMAYYNNYLMAATSTGLTFTIAWPAGTLINTTLGNVGTSVRSTLSNPASSLVLSSNPGVAGSGKGLMELYFANTNSTLPSIDGTTFLESTIGVTNLGIEPTAQLYAWMLSTSNSFISCRIYNITPPTQVLVSTEVQNPIGNDVAARIIRLRDCNDIGNACVESDQNIFPGATNIVSTSTRNYIEICLFGNIVNGNPPYTAWDIREFQS